MNFTLADGTRVHLIGDPHLGRKFETGVSLKNRGVREASLFQDFRDRLETDADIIIMVGDLFDHPYVGYGVVDQAAAAIRSAAERNSDVIYIMLAGNHDLPRDTTVVGAFHDLDDRLRDRYENLHIVRRPTVINKIALMPWEWDRRADEQASDIANEDYEAVVGHWDLSKFDDKDDHLAPVQSFMRVPLYSGHYHVPGDYEVDGITIHCTGSLQPLSHDQDPSGRLYVTVTLSEALSRPSGDFKGKHVRVVLQPGEDLPDLDAIAVTPKREKVAAKSADNTLSLKDFDWNKMLSERISKLDPKVQEYIKERLPYDDTTEQRGSGDQAVRQGTPDGNTSED